MGALRYSMRAKSTELLGPGKRAVFWVQGCSKNPPCKGCIGESARDPSGGIVTDAAEMAEWILSCRDITGITVSGGEPFDQPEAVAEVVRAVRKVCPGLSLAVYTGRTYEELCETAQTDAGTAALLSETGILIDGPYIPELDDGVPYRGSSNQRVLILDGDCRESAEAYYTNTPGRRIEVIADEKGTRMIGVPSKTQAEAWRRLKNCENIREEA